MAAVALPALPSSLGPTMMAVQGVALALALIGPQVKAAAGAQKAIGRVQTTCARAIGEFQVLAESANEAQRLAAAIGDENVPAIDRIAEARMIVYGFRENFDRAMKSKAELFNALQDLRRYDQILSFARPDWRTKVVELVRTMKELDEQIAATNLKTSLDDATEQVDALFAQAHRLTASGDLPSTHVEHPETRTVADEGYAAWLASLPDDEWSDAVDSSQETPLRWVDNVGWVTTE